MPAAAHLQQCHQQLQLLAVSGALQALSYIGCGYTDTANLDFDRLIKVLCCQLLDLLGHGGTEEQRLVRGGQALHTGSTQQAARQ